MCSCHVYMSTFYLRMPSFVENRYFLCVLCKKDKEMSSGELIFSTKLSLFTHDIKKCRFFVKRLREYIAHQKICATFFV
jgi:hypothetical protein